MFELQENIFQLLCDLKENCHAVAVKSEFESEGASYEEILYLKKLISPLSLELTVKIGGCEAIRDMRDAKAIGVQSLVAPLVESCYAVEKFINATKRIFDSCDTDVVDYYINIETITGVNCLPEILKHPVSEYIKGIVFGRTDMVGSLACQGDVNSDIILNYANKIACLCLEYNKKFVIGGGVSVASLPFLKNVAKNSLSKVETRKIVFDASGLLNDENAKVCINKALEFEALWIKNKQKQFGFLSQEDKKRITLIESRLR